MKTADHVTPWVRPLAIVLSLASVASLASLASCANQDATSPRTAAPPTPAAPDVFSPTTSTTLSGTQHFASVNIPAGVTVTATSDLDLSVSGALTIAGTLTGNCVAMSIAADGAAAVTGVVSNVCTDPSAAGKDLSIVGKSGIAAKVAKVASSGNVLLTNDLTLTDSSFPTPSGDSVAAQRITKSITRSSTRSSTRSIARSGTGTRTASFAEAAAEHDCSLTGVQPIPRPAVKGAPSVSGASAKELKLSCNGNAEIGGPGGATITAASGGAGGDATSVSNTFAEARAGDAGNGGTFKVFVTGDLTITGVTRLVSGDGGDGGVATATGLPNPALVKQPSAQATGGRGGMPGLVDVRVGGTLDIEDELDIVIGRAGDGGDAIATGAAGLDATATSPAKEGGDARPTGGEGGSTPSRQLSAIGNIVVGASGSIVVSGGDAGDAGSALGTAGVGGAGSQQDPAGGKGGSFLFNQNNAWNGSNAHVGNGGSAQLRDLAGNLIGHGGNGSITSGLNGNGGIGWSGCGTTPPSAGGPGGPGGSAVGHDGTGGSGVVRGLNGTITFTNAGNGGNGGSGDGPGTGGKGGTDATTSLRPKTLNPPDFMDGNPGNGCEHSSARTEAVEIVVQSDPNAEEQFVRYTSVQQVSIIGGGSTPGATSTIMIQGSAPWVTVSGVFGGATFMATGSGAVGGYSNIAVTFTGSMSTTGLISGTIQIALPSGMVKYTLTQTG